MGIPGRLPNLGIRWEIMMMWRKRGKTLGYPSVLSSANQGISAPSRRLITSAYSSSLTSAGASLKFTVAGGAETSSGTGNVPTPRSSPSSITPSELVLPNFCCTTRGGLKLRSSPKTRITPFRALADNSELLAEDWNWSARRRLGSGVIDSTMMMVVVQQQSGYDD